MIYNTKKHSLRWYVVQFVAVTYSKPKDTSLYATQRGFYTPNKQVTAVASFT